MTGLYCMNPKTDNLCEGQSRAITNLDLMLRVGMQVISLHDTRGSE